MIGRRRLGGWVVLDAVEFRLTFDRLLPVALERYRLLAEQFNLLPVLCIEEASSGQQLLDIIRSSFPALPLLAARPVKSKIVRAEGVTPFTMARSVSLLKAQWNSDFIACMANFPADSRDHFTDAFCHAMKCFVGTGSDFKKPDFCLPQSAEDAAFEARQEARYAAEFAISPELDAFDRGWGWW